MNFILRGHVRSSFNDRSLLGLLEIASRKFDIKIYAHTWNVVQNSISWRRIEDVPNKVDEGSVRNYLSGLDVRWVSVDDDKCIRHVGKTEGNIGRTPCPVLGWKNMYWGIVKAANAVADNESPESLTVQTRFDLLSNPFAPSTAEVLAFLSREHKSIVAGPKEERIRFLHMRCFLGVDNIYMAKAEDIRRFVSYMYYDMDRILHEHKHTYHQEHIAFHERKSLSMWDVPRQPMQ